MVTFRSFRNTDIPSLVKVWNDSFPNRGAVHLTTSSLFDRQVLCLPYFDPEGLIIAQEEETDAVVGFAHSGFGPTEDQSQLDPAVGIICILAVRPSHRRQGIGTELLKRSEAYLLERGAKELFAGPSPLRNPFYLGLYGGSDTPGILTSDSLAGPFLKHHGYHPIETTIVYQRMMVDPLRITDPRFVSCRQQYDIYADASPARPTWWQNANLGMIEPIEFRMEEKTNQRVIAKAQVIELEGFTWKWNQPAVGISDVIVEEEFREKGLGKFFLTQILRFLQEQCFLIAEMQVPEENQPIIHLCQAMGFNPVDIGKTYKKS